MQQILVDAENQTTHSIKFGVAMKFYKPTPGTKDPTPIDMDIKTYVPPPDVIEKQVGGNRTSLFVPVPANSSHLKDPNVIQTLRQHFPSTYLQNQSRFVSRLIHISKNKCVGKVNLGCIICTHTCVYVCFK